MVIRSQCVRCGFGLMGDEPCAFCALSERHATRESAEQLPLQAALGDFGQVKAALDRDQAALGVDPTGKPPLSFHSSIPMDDGPPTDRLTVDRGFYRQYDAVWTETPLDVSEVTLLVETPDARQITWEIARECPVTGTVVFRLVDGRIVAQLTSYVAFA